MLTTDALFDGRLLPLAIDDSAAPVNYLFNPNSELRTPNSEIVLTAYRLLLHRARASHA